VSNKKLELSEIVASFVILLKYLASFKNYSSVSKTFIAKSLNLWRNMLDPKLR
jgi:hypothetical protein